MNTIIFPLDGRPQVTLGSTVESSLFKGSLVEIAKDYIIVQAPKELPLRGRIKINDTELIFSKKEETLVGHTFYAHLSVDAKELFALKVHFLARLKSEELTQWMTHKSDESESRPVTQEASFSAPITSGIGAVIAKILNAFYKHPIIAGGLTSSLFRLPSYSTEKLNH